MLLLKLCCIYQILNYHNLTIFSLIPLHQNPSYFTSLILSLTPQAVSELVCFWDTLSGMAVSDDVGDSSGCGDDKSTDNIDTILHNHIITTNDASNVGSDNNTITNTTNNNNTASNNSYTASQVSSFFSEIFSECGERATEVCEQV